MKRVFLALTVLCTADIAAAQAVQNTFRRLDDGRDIQVLLGLRNDYVDAVQAKDAARVTALDDELGHWFAGEAREERRESRQARRELRGSRKEVFTERDYDAFHDLNDDRRDLRKQTFDRLRNSQQRRDLEALKGHIDETSMNRRIDLLDAMLMTAKNELRRDRRETREDRRERREDRRERR